MNIEWPGIESQSKARESLLQAMVQGTFPQSVLIAGPEGIGKKKLALELADLLVCESKEHKPCGECYGCRIVRGKYEHHTWVLPLDITGEDIKKKEKRDVAVEDVRKEVVKNPFALNTINRQKDVSVHLVRAAIGDVEGRKQDHIHVILIPEADLMNASAANALLKTLEEVPDKCYFILTTSHRQRLLPTIKSRCLTVSLPPLENPEVRSILDSLGETEVDEQVIRFSAGCAGRALQFAGADFKQIHKSALEFTEMALKHQFDRLLQWVDKESCVKDSAEALPFLDMVYIFLADLYCLHRGLPARNVEVAEKLHQMIPNGWELSRWPMLMEKTQSAVRKLRSNCQPPIVVGSLGLSFADKI